MSDRTFKELIEEYKTKGDVQIKLVTGEKIHGTIDEVGDGVIVLGLGSEKRLVNMQNIVLISPSVL